MSYTMTRNLALSVLLGGFIAFGQAAEQKATIDGMEVYYGIVPAEIVKKQAERNPPAMHSRRVGRNYRHLVVALFDAQSGQRLTDAAIDATVTPLGLAPSTKHLEQMRIGDTITYGHFFDFPPGTGPYRIALKISRPQRATHEVVFDYRP